MKAVKILTTHTLAAALCCALGACSGGKSAQMVDSTSNIKPRAEAVANGAPADTNKPEAKKAEGEDKKTETATSSDKPTTPNKTTVPDRLPANKTDANGIPVDENGKRRNYSGLGKSDDDILRDIFGNSGSSLSIGNMFSDDNSDEDDSTEEASGRDLSNYFTDNKEPKADDIDDEEDDTAPAERHNSVSSPAPAFSATPISTNVFGGTDGVVSSTLSRTLLDSALKDAELSDTPDNKLTLELDDQKITLDLARVPSAEDRKSAQTRWSPISLDNGIYLRTNDAITANSLPSEFDVKFGMMGDIFDEETRQFYVQGQATPMNEMPVKDVMHYRGGAVVDQAGSVLSTAINADVDFANKQIAFDLAAGKDKFGHTSPALQFKAEIAQNHFAGKSGSVQTQGAFYGKNASELAGVFLKDATTDHERADHNQSARGVFGLKQSGNNQ